MSLELNYKARNVAQAESKYRTSIQQAMQELTTRTFGVVTFAFLLEAGGIEEDKAYDLIDEVGVNAIETEVVEALLDAGFLRGTNDDQRKEALKQLKEAKASSTTGNAKK